MQTKIEELTKANDDLTDDSAALEVFLSMRIPFVCRR